MPLETGTRLGPYEVLAPLGAGGMGEVYRARDTRLDRTVAVKVLPPALREDTELRQRLDREARALSSFAHPHICTLYDVGHQEGFDYLVMEFLEGDTLAQRLEKGQVPLEQGVRIAAEIADALDAAHRKGVIHRDLKPGNIMLTKTGVKLLDFGLAKRWLTATGSGTSTVHILDAPTVQHNTPLTTQGAMVGTYPYMAPEQVEGKEADARSDIFSLGAVLYELFTGVRAFPGKTPASVIAAILSSDPRPVAAILPDVPPGLDRLIRTCLNKDPEARWQTVHDIKLQLEGILEAGVTSVASGLASTVRTAPPLPVPAARTTAGRERLAWALAVLGIVVAAAFGGMLLRRAPAPSGTPAAAALQAALLPPAGTDVQFADSDSGPPALSPDGTRIVFPAAAQDGGVKLWLRVLSEREAQPLKGTEEAAHPFWSPDGEWIGFFAQGKLKKVEYAGGAAIALCDAPVSRGAAWGADGTILFAPGYKSGLLRVSAQGGKPAPATSLDEARHSLHLWPQFLPDGQAFVYVAASHDSALKEHAGLFLATLDGKENRLLLKGVGRALYASGHLIYAQGGALMAHPFDAVKRELSGQPAVLAPAVRSDDTFWAGIFTVSQNGVLAFLPEETARHSELIWFDRAGKKLETVDEPALYGDLRLSPDGARLAAQVGEPSDIWVFDVARRTRARFTFTGDKSELAPVWSRDSRWIAFAARKSRTEPHDLYRKPASGAESEEHLNPSRWPLIPQDWTADGAYLVYAEGDPLLFGQSRIWLYPVAEAHGDSKPYSEDKALEYHPQLSPDGKWLAYTSRATGREEVFVSAFPEPSGKWQVSASGGNRPRWRRDAREIFYLSPDGRMMAAEVRASSGTFESSPARALFNAHAVPESFSYDVAPDGSRFLVNWAGQNFNQTPLDLILNWPALARKR